MSKSLVQQILTSQSIGTEASQSIPNSFVPIPLWKLFPFICLKWQAVEKIRFHIPIIHHPHPLPSQFLTILILPSSQQTHLVPTSAAPPTASKTTLVFLTISPAVVMPSSASLGPSSGRAHLLELCSSMNATSSYATRTRLSGRQGSRLRSLIDYPGCSLLLSLLERVIWRKRFVFPFCFQWSIFLHFSKKSWLLYI